MQDKQMNLACLAGNYFQILLINIISNLIQSKITAITSDLINCWTLLY